MRQRTDRRDGSEEDISNDCRFCAAAMGLSREPEDRPLAESRNFIVVASVGSLVPGWTMVVPRSHSLNFAQFYADPEAVELRRRLAVALENEFGAPVRMFEHGATSSGSMTGCGVDHAHLHLVPLEPRLRDLAGEAGDLAWRDVLSGEIPTEVRNAEYLLMSDEPARENPRCEMARLDVPRSQYFRRLIAGWLGDMQLHNYREHPLPAIARETQQRLRLLKRPSSERPRSTA